MHPGDSNSPGVTLKIKLQKSLIAQGIIVLGYLESLGKVGIKIILAVEFGLMVDPAVQSQTQHKAFLNCQFIGHRQRSWQTQADRADMAVGLSTKIVSGTAAKHFALSFY